MLSDFSASICGAPSAVSLHAVPTGGSLGKRAQTKTNAQNFTQRTQKMDVFGSLLNLASAGLQ